jgi:chaperonin cofactor prefoldin
VAEYVTQTAFRKHAHSVDKRFDAVDKRFDAVDKRFDAFEQRLMDFLGRWATEIDTNIARHVRASEQRLRAELGSDLAGQILASEERLRSEIRGLDDQYRDLPTRVAALEDHTGIKR